ncbi:MAG: hypothetical protein U0R71_09235 [Solirubrobacterales bacterium]
MAGGRAGGVSSRPPAKPKGTAKIVVYIPGRKKHAVKVIPIDQQG